MTAKPYSIRVLKNAPAASPFIVRIKTCKKFCRHICLHSHTVVPVLLLQQLAIPADGLDPPCLGIGEYLFKENAPAAYDGPEDLLQPVNPDRKSVV